MKRVLLIEDQPQMRRNLATILEMEGYEVTTAEHGRRGLELARTSRPDLILCDVMMPEMDGYELLRELRGGKATATVPFIFLTAKGEKNDLRAGMNLGADDYLTKPVSRDDLLAALQARFTRHQLEKDHGSRESSAVFDPDFSSPEPLRALGLTPREAEVVLCIAQGKSNPDIGIILGMAERTVKKHVEHIFEKLGMENRQSVAIRALEELSRPIRPET